MSKFMQEVAVYRFIASSIMIPVKQFPWVCYFILTKDSNEQICARSCCVQVHCIINTINPHLIILNQVHSNTGCLECRTIFSINSSKVFKTVCSLSHSPLFRWIPYKFLWKVMVESILGSTIQEVHFKVFCQLCVFIL